jgi:hypothetical protein
MFVFVSCIQTSLMAQSLRDFGAVCNWGQTSPADDTNAIRAAIASNPTGTVSLVFPSDGLCRITGPISVPYNVNFYGYGPGSGLVADYSAWTNTSDLHALELVDTTGGFSLGQTFQNFSIIGSGNSSIQSTGFYASDGLNNPGSEGGSTHYLNGIQVRNLNVQNFDTAFQISDVSFSLFDFIQVSNVRNGFVMLGQNLNTFVEHFFANNFGTSNTSNKSTTTGFLIDQKTYPQGQVGPEGITLSNSVIIGAYDNLIVNTVLQMNVLNNVFDASPSNSVILGNPNNINFEHNYVATTGTGQTAILIGGGTNYDGLNISNNLLNGTGAPAGQNGIYFETGFTHRNAHIENNRIQSFANPVVFFSLPTLSSVKGNYGWNNSTTGFFITVNQTGTCGQGTTIEGNTTSDPVSTFGAACSGFHLGYNYSPN